MEVCEVRSSGRPRGQEEATCHSPILEVLPGIALGRLDQLLTPAYWQWRCTIGEAEGHDYINRTGTLREEVGFCLLGGYGIPFEVNEAFFQLLKRHGVFAEGHLPVEASILDLLKRPIPVEGRLQRYRFPHQKAERITRALRLLDELDFNSEDSTSFRAALCQLPGIGPKTASWITRNWLGAECVAILDVHVLRAGRFLGIFDRHARLPRDYDRLEACFLRFAEAIAVRPSVLDAVMWSDMRTFGSRMVTRLNAG